MEFPGNNRGSCNRVFENYIENTEINFKKLLNSGNYSNLNFSQTVFQDLETQFRVAAELPSSKEVTLHILGFDIHSCAKSTTAHQSDSSGRQTRSRPWKCTPASQPLGKLDEDIGSSWLGWDFYYCQCKLTSILSNSQRASHRHTLHTVGLNCI